MKRKTLGQKILVAAFVLILCLGSVWSGIFHVLRPVTENREKRELASFPVPNLESYGTYAKDFENYFDDHLPFRSELISFNSLIDLGIFHQSTNDNVLIGKNGWLYYVRQSDGDPIASYMGKDLLSEEELQTLCKNCQRISDELAAMGKEFVIFIAPNKERIYSEYMPDLYGKPAEEYRALQVVEYLREHSDVRVVYPYEELMAAKERINEPVYFSQDTHWNHIGGYVGTMTLARELGIEMPGPGDDELEIRPISKCGGDLADMLNLPGLMTGKDWNYSITGYNAAAVEVLNNDSELISMTSKSEDHRKLFMCRDSFAIHMAQYIGSQFEVSWLRHRENYTYEEFCEQDPDIFVYETVERYVDTLIDFSLQGNEE